jgi:hypothetical protein
LNEALPEEAQIAIREFPSKEAQTVGLLSRGETLEVTVRGGNWLQIAGGTLDKAWIMWRTDALELLQEAPDVSSGSCQPVEHNMEGSADDRGEEDQADSGGTKAAAKISFEVPGGCMDDRPDQPQVGSDETEYGDVTFATVVVKHFDLEKNTSDEVTKPWGDKSTEPSMNVSDGAIVTAPVENDMAASDDVIVGPPEDKGTGSSWDDRPTRPARNICMGEASAGDSRFTVDDEAEEKIPVHPWDDLPIRSASTVADGVDNNDGVAFDAVAVARMEAVHNVELWDDHPIRPAQIQLDDFGLDGDIAIVRDAAADDFVPAAPSLAEHAAVVQALDDRPIKPASTVPETIADSVLNIAPDAEGIAPAADNDSSNRGCTAHDGNEERARAQSWDDRPIAPASTALVAPETVTDVESTEAFEEDRAVYSAAEVAENETTGDNEGENIAPCDDAKETDDVQTPCSPDDRPIRPAQSMAVDEACGTAVKVTENASVDAPTLEVCDVGGNHDKENMETVAVSNTVNDRAIRPAEIPAVEEAGVPATENDACAEVAESKFDTSFSECEALNKVGVSLGSPSYSNGEAKSKPMSGSEAGDIVVLGGLDDAFDPVDELIMDIRGVDVEKDVRHSESNPKEVYNESVRGGSRDAADADSVAQTTPHTEGVDQSVTFLRGFGVIKYCEQKQSLYPVSDKLSQAMFNADQDDADLVFEVLVGDDPLADDWFHDVTSRGLQPEMISASTARDSKMRSTYDLIMGNGRPEDILEAELSSDNEGDFDLVVSFKYPSPERRAIEPNRASSPFRRVPSAPSRMTALEGHAESSPSKSASENGFDAEESLLMSRSPSNQHTPAKNPPQLATKGTSPPKTALPGPPKMSSSTRSRLTQRSPMVTPSSIGKPPSALSRPRSFIQSSHLATPTRSAITKTSSPSLAPPSEASVSSVAASGASPSRMARPLLQRRSFLATPSPSKALGVSPSTRNSMTGSIPKPAEVSGLQVPQKSFGFRRPSGLAKKS